MITDEYLAATADEDIDQDAVGLKSSDLNAPKKDLWGSETYEQKAKRLSKKPLFASTEAEAQMAADRAKKLFDAVKSGDGDALATEYLNFMDITQLVSSKSGNIVERNSEEAIPVYTEQELKQIRNMLKERLGEERGEAEYRQAVNRNQAAATNLKDDATDLIKGLMIGLPKVMIDTVVDGTVLTLRSQDPSLTMKERVEASKAAARSFTQLPDMFAGGLTSGLVALSKGARGVKEEPLNVALTILDLKGAAAAGAKAAKVVKEGRIPSPREIGREFVDASSVNVVGKAKEFIKIKQKTSDGKGWGLLAELLTDGDAKANNEFRGALREADEASRGEFWKSFNQIQGIKLLDEAQIIKLDQALRFGDDALSMKNAYKAVNLMQDLKKAVEEINAAERQGADELIIETRNAYDKTLAELNKELLKIEETPVLVMEEGPPLGALQRLDNKGRKQARLEQKALRQDKREKGFDPLQLVDKAKSLEGIRPDTIQRIRGEQAAKRAEVNRANQEIYEAKKKADEDIDAAIDTEAAMITELNNAYAAGKKQRAKDLASLKRPVKTPEASAQRDAILAEITSDFSGLQKRNNKTAAKTDKELAKTLNKSIDATKSGGANLVQWLNKNQNPYLEFSYKGTPMTNAAFLFGLDELVASGKFDPSQIKVKALKKEYEPIADIALKSRQVLSDLAMQQRDINVGTLDKPVMLVPTEALAANMSSYVHNSTRPGKFNIEKLERRLDAERTKKKEQLLDDKSLMQGTPAIDRGIGPRQRKTVSRLDDEIVSAEKKAEEYRLLGAADLVTNIQAGITKTQRSLQYYKFLNDLVKNQLGIVKGGPLKGPAARITEKILFKDMDELNAYSKSFPMRDRNYIASEFVKVPTIKTEPGNKNSPLLYGPISGMIIRKAEFEAINRTWQMEKLIDMMTFEGGLSKAISDQPRVRQPKLAEPRRIRGAGDVFAAALDLNRDIIAYQRAINTVSNPVYFANTVKGYTEMLAQNNVPPHKIWQNMEKNTKLDNPYRDAFFETGIPKNTAAMYGVLKDLNINPSSIGIFGLPKGAAKSVKGLGKELLVDWKQLGQVSEALAKAKRKSSDSALVNAWNNKNSIKYRQFLLSLPSNLKDIFGLNGFNSAVAAMIDVSARVTMFEHLVNQRAKARGESPMRVLEDKAAVAELARLADELMINYDGMGRINETVARNHPVDPFHNWWAASTSNLFRKTFENPLANKAAMQSEKQLRATLSAERQRARDNLPVRMRGMVLELDSPAQEQLFLNLAYSSLNEPSQIDPMKLLTLGIILEPKTNRDMIERKMAEAEGFLSELGVSARNTIAHTDMGLAKIWNGMAGRSDFWSLERDPTQGILERVMYAATDAAMPNIWNFYFLKEMTSLFDQKRQKDNIRIYGHPRSGMLNLGPAELVLRSFGVPLNRMNRHEMSTRWGKAFEAKVNDINKKYGDRIRDAQKVKDFDEVRTANELRRDVIRLIHDIAEQQGQEGFYE